MAKGSEAKNQLFSKIMEIYPDAFWEDQGKILRVPMSEAGTRVEIKVTLTAAKTNMGGESVPSAFGSVASPSAAPAPKDAASLEMTQEEKENVAKMLKALNL